MAPPPPKKAKPKPPPKKLVERIANALNASPTASFPTLLPTVPGGTIGAFPALYTFTGFVDNGRVQHPGVAAKTWQLMYLDLQMRNWLLIEGDGIVHTETVTDDDVPGGQRDLLWVTADAAVGIGSGPQSLEARFLTGEFTRAADFRASPAGGTLAAATGVFCEAQSVGCCRPSS